MPLTSLNNFTVPTNGVTPTQGLLMPKLKYRFRVTLSNFGADADNTELTRQVVDVTRPQVSFQEMELPVYNSRVYLAGKYEFQTMSINLRDDASGIVQRSVGQQIQKQFDFQEQASARSGVDYKFTTRIEILDGGNGATVNTLEAFLLYGCFLQNVDYGDLNYATNEPATIALTVRFDNMEQLKGSEGGTGTAIEGFGEDIGAAFNSTLGTNTTGGGQ